MMLIHNFIMPIISLVLLFHLVVVWVLEVLLCLHLRMIVIWVEVFLQRLARPSIVLNLIQMCG